MNAAGNCANRPLNQKMHIAPVVRVLSVTGPFIGNPAPPVKPILPSTMRILLIIEQGKFDGFADVAPGQDLDAARQRGRVR